MAGTATLTFLDDQDEERKLSLNTTAWDIGVLRLALKEQRIPYDGPAPPKLFTSEVADDWCAHFRGLDIDARIVSEHHLRMARGLEEHWLCQRYSVLRVWLGSPGWIGRMVPPGIPRSVAERLMESA